MRYWGRLGRNEDEKKQKIYLEYRRNYNMSVKKWQPNLSTAKSTIFRDWNQNKREYSRREGLPVKANLMTLKGYNNLSPAEVLAILVSVAFLRSSKRETYYHDELSAIVSEYQIEKGFMNDIRANEAKVGK